MDYSTGSTELGTTGRIIAKPCAADAFFLLLVALLAGFLVFLDKLKQVCRKLVQREFIQRQGKVGTVPIAFSGLFLDCLHYR